jgi:hypothetical protein
MFSFFVAGMSKTILPYLDQAPLLGEVAFFGAQLKKKEALSEFRTVTHDVCVCITDLFYFYCFVVLRIAYGRQALYYH